MFFFFFFFFEATNNFLKRENWKTIPRFDAFRNGNIDSRHVDMSFRVQIDASSCYDSNRTSEID